MGLCLPRSRCASAVARRPSVLPSALTRYQARRTDSGLAEKVFMYGVLSYSRRGAGQRGGILLADPGWRKLSAFGGAGRHAYIMASCGPPSPAAALAEPALSDDDRRTSAALMRVNHAGEIAAQALYSGQALFARSPAT